MVLVGLVLDHTHLHTFTLDFLNLKERFFPAFMAGCRPLGMILKEIKGSDVRKSIRSRRRERRQAVGFLDSILELLERHDVKLVGRVLIKRVAQPINEINAYTSYMQAICTCFHRLLESKDSHGLIIADSRLPHQNEIVSHSIFTQKFKRAGDDHSRILEMPTFGHSVNHAGLQVADIIASALLFPMAAHAFSLGHVSNVHVNPNFGLLRARYGERIKALQFRYQDSDGRWRGGITVSDQINQRSGGSMFRQP